MDFSLSLKEKVLSNKIRKGVEITWMKEALIPLEYSMEVISHQELFLCPRPKWKRSDKILFTTSPIGCNQLQLIVDNLTFGFSFLKEKKLLNKTRRRIEINTNGEGSHSMRVQHGGYGSSRPNLIYGKTTLSFFYFLFFTFIFGFKFLFFFCYVHLFLVFWFMCFWLWFSIVVLFVSTIKLTHTWEKTLQCIINGQCHW